MVVGVRVEQAPTGFGEHPPFVVPELAGGALNFLLLPVDLQQHDKRVGLASPRSPAPSRPSPAAETASSTTCRYETQISKTLAVSWDGTRVN